MGETDRRLPFFEHFRNQIPPGTVVVFRGFYSPGSFDFATTEGGKGIYSDRKSQDVFVIQINGDPNCHGIWTASKVVRQDSIRGEKN